MTRCTGNWMEQRWCMWDWKLPHTDNLFSIFIDSNKPIEHRALLNVGIYFRLLFPLHAAVLGIINKCCTTYYCVTPELLSIFFFLFFLFFFFLFFSSLLLIFSTYSRFLLDTVSICYSSNQMRARSPNVSIVSVCACVCRSLSMHILSLTNWKRFHIDVESANKWITSHLLIQESSESNKSSPMPHQPWHQCSILIYSFLFSYIHSFIHSMSFIIFWFARIHILALPEKMRNSNFSFLQLMCHCATHIVIGSTIKDNSNLYLMPNMSNII